MILDRIQHWARAQPRRAALIHNDTIVDYASFARMIGAAKAFFDRQNLAAGVAVVMIGNIADAWVIVLALRACGLTTICVTSLAAAEALQLRDVTCVVVMDGDRSNRLLGPGPFAGARLLVVPRNVFHAPVDAPPSTTGRTPVFGGHILYTSGTTGRYKKVLWDPAVEDARNQRVAAFRQNNSTTTHHVFDFGLWTAIGFDRPMAVWHVGGGVVIDQARDPFRRLFRHNITKATLLPSMFNDLLTRLSPHNRPGPGFELSVSGGFLSEATAAEALKRVSPSLTVFYGATECSGVARVTASDAAGIHWLTAAKDRQIEVVDELGRLRPANSEGEVRVRLLDSDPRGYLDDDDATGRVFRDGCFYPGDMGVRRPDGRIRVLGRSADVINVEGRKVAVAPLEQRVQALLRVDDVCLLSGLNAQGLEELVVVLEARSLPAPAELEQVAQHFASFGRIRFEAVEAFPRTEAGMRKLNRAELRKWMFSSRDADASAD